MHFDGISIKGVGHCLPDNIQDNESLCKNLSVTPEWIMEKTGIERRYIAGPDDTASGFALKAAEKAIEMAGIQTKEINLIIACTFSGDYIFPPLSAKLHKDLKAGNTQIFDIQANCCGFVTGLTVATDRMKMDDSIQYALVVGVEFCSRYIDRTDVNTAIYISDGAGAAILGRTASDMGIIASAFSTDSSNYESVRMRGGGSCFPINGRIFDPEVDLMEMNGVATWKQAVTHLPIVLRKACQKAGIAATELDIIIFHQANYNLIEYVVRKMGLDMSKTHTNVREIGNTGSASVAIALSEAVQTGKIRKGDKVALAAVGAGFNFGASVWLWDGMGREIAE